MSHSSNLATARAQIPWLTIYRWALLNQKDKYEDKNHYQTHDVILDQFFPLEDPHLVM
jgi:hypothetical protein